MNNLSLQRESIEPRLDGIQKELLLLGEFSQLPFDEFQKPVVFDRAQLHLRFVLEGIFHIGSHILSRIPGGRFTEYKEIARRLGETGIVSEEFAEKKLVPMAGYRNRLTHFYAEITDIEMYQILHDHLEDIREFLRAIKMLMVDPQKFGLRLE